MKAALILVGLALAISSASARPTPDSAQPTDTERASTSPYESIILHDGTNWTMVPQGALLHVPDQLQEHIAVRPLGTLMSWKEFVARNQSWLGAEAITLRQAEGAVALDQRRLRYFERQARMIVAVHSESPIVVAAATDESLSQTAALR